ncbi:hypothetical protein AB833_04205 [Chromatiales bacterium (ex Bugula neritina AB1)]|nr:hypothetical protein AB833_04205 [Chromatiales bacterium (ex Bugula neritina AB1)]
MLGAILADYHNVVDESVAFLFRSESIWLHVVGHTVLIVMPILFVFIVLKWTIELLHISNQRRRTNNIFRSSSSGQQYKIPCGLMAFILTHSAKRQIYLSVIALSILPITYSQLELPKRIIDGAISTTGSLNSQSLNIKAGISQTDYLLFLCALYLSCILASSCLKYSLNLRMGKTTERLIRLMRLLIIKQTYYKPVHRMEDPLIPVITQEVEPVCRFGSSAVIAPLLHGGTVITIISFMMMQNVILGAAALTMVPVQLFLIPKMQRTVNQLVKIRIGIIRALTGNIQNRYTTSSRRVTRENIKSLHNIRNKFYKAKYLMKALNNFIMNLTPFFFFTIGGYMVLMDQLTLGALVASLASYKDLAPAFRELFKYYQNYHDAKSRYREILNYVTG